MTNSGRQVINEDYEEQWAQDRALRHATSDRLPFRCDAVDDHSLTLVEKPNSNGSVTDNIFNICKTLNDYFYAVFEVKPQGPLPSFLNQSSVTCDSRIDFVTYEEVKNKLLKLDLSKAIGPDGIHPRVLKNCAEAFSIPLTMLFKSSILTSFVPDQWRKAEVTPIFKKGNKLKARLYNPRI
nr:uncharacterized protein LOC124815026 [Hydra vulgaris]